ncbi:hypothetical protein SAMN05444339_10239 [Loktanella atrilutea]|uniref:Uncharacterized protein n=1 Tax=Loktanella atrilutea TaxID=366533 RepID=A0A1M4W9J6_LOKAT|nr:hypothetical protein [Loktanella atrilutea]SHE77938.1 hypothetical protein SAMN05444339_10239 [Loktanella atrilutea]
MTGTKKTAQAMKLAATWTPNETLAASIAKSMMLSHGATIAGGKLRIELALFAEHDNVDRVQANAAALNELRANLAFGGTIHAWHITAGAAPRAMVLDVFKDFAPVSGAANDDPDPDPAGAAAATPPVADETTDAKDAA